MVSTEQLTVQTSNPSNDSIHQTTKLQKTAFTELTSTSLPSPPPTKCTKSSSDDGGLDCHHLVIRFERG